MTLIQIDIKDQFLQIVYFHSLHAYKYKRNTAYLHLIHRIFELLLIFSAEVHDLVAQRFRSYSVN